LNILLVEDDIATVESIKLCFEVYSPGSRVVSTDKGLEALQMSQGQDFDIIIIDLGLPDIDGLEVLKQLRNFFTKPVIVVSARHDLEVVSQALEIGIYDYILKPFNYRLLLDRVRIIGNQASLTENRNRCISHRGLMIDLAAKKVTLNGNQQNLTNAEWNTLSYLIENQGRLVPVNILREKAEMEEKDTEVLSIESMISALKAKLGDTLSNSKMIISEYGVGYRFLEP
jgi:two-component system, OmpR family, KDP operon response regulator KdpE